MNRYLDKVLYEYKLAQWKHKNQLRNYALVAKPNKPIVPIVASVAKADTQRDYSGLTKPKERMVMDQYMSNKVLSTLPTNKTTNFYLESKNVKGPTLGNMMGNFPDAGTFNGNVTLLPTYTQVVQG